MQGAFNEICQVHKPDNGLMTTALQLCCYKYFLAELKVIKGEKHQAIDQPIGQNYIEDDSIVGNPDKMLFYSKEFLATAEDD